MPTPFYHLWIAQDLLVHPGLSRELKRFLNQNRPAFLFGNTAPDVQVVSHQPRQATHFFDVPLQPGQPSAVEKMLADLPQLAYSYQIHSVHHMRPVHHMRTAHQMPDAQVAFLAGYLCHLQADWLWVRQVFDPLFGVAAGWGRMADRLYIHNVLRAYQDRTVITGLDGHTGSYLEAVIPDRWLPFVEDVHLCQWRDFLTPQLKPHAPLQTVEVFAARQGIPSERYYRLLDSQERMQQEVFIHLSPQQLETYRTQLLVESAQLLSRYLEHPDQGAYRQASAGMVL